MSSSESETGKPRIKSNSVNLEKRLKRKTSHSEIEKRRRQKINYTLKQLQTLIPWLDNDCQYQKLEILEHAVDFIGLLKAKTTDSEPNISPAYEHQPIDLPSPLSSTSTMVTDHDITHNNNTVQNRPIVGQRFIFHKNNRYLSKKTLSRISKHSTKDKPQSENQMSIRYLMS